MQQVGININSWFLFRSGGRGRGGDDSNIVIIEGDRGGGGGFNAEDNGVEVSVANRFQSKQFLSKPCE